MDVPNLDFLIYDIGTMIVPASQGHGERQIERRMEVSAWEATPPFPGPCLKPPSERSPGGVIAMQAFSLSLSYSQSPQPWDVSLGTRDTLISNCLFALLCASPSPRRRIPPEQTPALVS